MDIDVAPIAATDEEIAEALEHASIPALLAALVHLTGDIEIVRKATRPQNILGAEERSEALEKQAADTRRIALETLIHLRDQPRTIEALPSDVIRELTNFIAGKPLDDDYLEFALSELAIGGTDAFSVPGLEEVNPPTERGFHVAIIGAGMSGLLAAYRMRNAGISCTVLEKNDDVGGTWYENRYPGCRVDSPNHVYAYSFAPKDWPMHFSDQSVLLQYFREITDRYDLRDLVNFGHEVTECRYSPDEHRWQLTVATPNGVQVFSANAIVMAVGQLNRRKMPDLPGIDSFRGPSFHSSQWDHSVDLSGKRVGIIGTGASAFQFTPEVAKEARSISVFLRTPPWVAINPQYRKTISEHEHWLLNHVPYYGKWFRFHMFWVTSEGMLEMTIRDPGWNETRSVSERNERLRQTLVNGLEHQLEGRSDLIEKLTPSYPPGSKRMLIDDGHWYRTLQRPNVSVIDSQIDSICEQGIRTSDGTTHDFDVIVYGTGFKASEILFPMDIYDADGNELRTRWGDDPRAYLGITVPRCPNLFCLYGPNTNIVVNGSITFFSECEVRYVTSCLRHLLKNDLKAMDCRQSVHDSYNEMIDEYSLKRAWSVDNVRSWYKNRNGRVTQCWPGTMIEYWKQTQSVNPSDYRFT